MSELLAAYFESQAGLTRHFELFEDRVVVKGRKKWLMFTTVSFEAPIMLVDLRPLQGKTRSLQRPFIVGYSLLLLAFIAFLVFVTANLVEARSFAPHSFLCVSAILAAVGVPFCVRSSREIEWTRFQNHFGTVILDIARSGPECAKYDAFVELLVRQIEAVHRYREKILRDAMALNTLGRQIESKDAHP